MIDESNFTNSLDGVIDEFSGDFGDLCLAIFDRVSFGETFISLSWDIHEFEFEWFHDILNFFRFFLYTGDKLINIVDIFIETYIDGTGKFIIDKRL